MKRTNCIICKIEFGFYRAQGYNDAKYCSRKCFAHKKSTGKCLRCDKEFEFWASIRSGKFCSRLCQNRTQAEQSAAKYKEFVQSLSEIERVQLMKIAFDKHVIKKVDACWDWVGFKHNGYGRLGFLGKNITAHRASYMIHKGPLNGLNVLHKCDNPTCTNPEHLFLGTALDNNRDRESKGRSNHAKGSSFKRSTLDEQKVSEIKKLLALKVKSIDISKLYGESKMTISDIKTGKTWKHVIIN